MKENLPPLTTSAKEVPVLSYPNSGSSLLAGVLHHLGINMGNRLKRPQSVNPIGLYEDEDFTEILSKIWLRYNISLDYSRTINLDKLLETAKIYQNGLSMLIRQKQKQNIDWGIKEPRLSLLWPVFRHNLNNPYWIISCRDINRLVKSRRNKMNKRFRLFRIENIIYYIKKGHYFTILSYLSNSIRFLGVTENELKAVIDHYYRLIYDFVRDKNYLIVNYDNLLDHPQTEIHRITKFLSINLRTSQHQAAMNLVKPGLKHF